MSSRSSRGGEERYRRRGEGGFDWRQADENHDGKQRDGACMADENLEEV